MLRGFWVSRYPSSLHFYVFTCSTYANKNALWGRRVCLSVRMFSIQPLNRSDPYLEKWFPVTVGLSKIQFYPRIFLPRLVIKTIISILLGSRVRFLPSPINLFLIGEMLCVFKRQHYGRKISHTVFADVFQFIKVEKFSSCSFYTCICTDQSRVRHVRLCVVRMLVLFGHRTVYTNLENGP